MVSERLGTEPIKEDIDAGLSNQQRDENRGIRVKTYSQFLSEIAEDMGFTIVNDESYDYLIYPDYLREELEKKIQVAGESAVELPSHKNAPQNPVKRAQLRYQILESRTCMKH